MGHHRLCNNARILHQSRAPRQIHMSDKKPRRALMRCHGKGSEIPFTSLLLISNSGLTGDPGRRDKAPLPV